MLSIKNLSISVPEKDILKDINLDINGGEIHALLGPNGIGKSSICKTLMGYPNYKTSGSVLFNNEELLNMSVEERALKGLYLVNQSPSEIEGVSNAEMLRIALTNKTKEHINIYEFNKELINTCESLNFSKENIHRDINVAMSGGEKKKNELLHLWILKPSVIMLDEIDSGLDIDSLKIVLNSLKEYYDTYHPTIIIISHNTKVFNILKPNYVHIINNGIIKTYNKDIINTIEKTGFLNINE